MEPTAILILVLSFLIFLGIGLPVAWSIGLSTLFTMLVSIPLLPAATTVAQRLATGLDSFSLLAIPFFVLAGVIINRGGIARRLVDFARVLVGRLPGGLAHVNIIAAMLMGAIAGSAVAAASAIGSFMTKEMEDEGYSREFSAAVNLTSATTGLVIPPSNILIVYSLASGGVSIAALFLAGYLPGILTGLFLMIVAAIIAVRKGYGVRSAEAVASATKVNRPSLPRAFVGAVPSLLLLIIVIGGIVAGIFTATEASAAAVLYCGILAHTYGEIGLKDWPRMLTDSAATTSVVLILVGASISMSWVMSYESIPQQITDLLLGISDNPIFILLAINLILLFVGIFMDMTPAVLIFTPIFLPIVEAMGMDPIHFGIIMVLNLCIGLCTPPVGTVLFVGVGIAGTTIRQVVRPLLPFFIAMILALLVVTYVPELSLWLPRLFGYG